MEKELKSITLILENTETITLPPSQISHLIIDNISSDYIKYKKDQNTIKKRQFAKEIFLQIENPETIQTNTDEQLNCLERIQNQPDITAIEFTYIDDEIERFNVDWANINPEINVYQKHAITNNKALQILIKRETFIKDYLEAHYIY